MLTKNFYVAMCHRMTPEQCRAARGWLDLSQTELAVAAGVSQSTVRDFEARRRKPIGNNMNALVGVLVDRGIQFIENGITGPEVTGPV